MNWKAYVAFNFNFLLKIKDFQGHGQAHKSGSISEMVPERHVVVTDHY